MERYPAVAPLNSQREEHLRDFGNSMSAISFGFVATAILIALFLLLGYSFRSIFDFEFRHALDIFCLHLTFVSLSFDNGHTALDCWYHSLCRLRSLMLSSGANHYGSAQR